MFSTIQILSSAPSSKRLDQRHHRFSGGGINGTFQVVGSEVNRWTVAADQELAKSGMHLYWVYQHFDSPELDLIDSDLHHRLVPVEGFDLFYTGARIYF